MSRSAVTVVTLLLAAGSTEAWSPQAWAQDADRVRAMNAVSDLARAHRDRADTLRRRETLQRDRDRADDRVRRKAEWDSRSMRRFDR
ncbi:hypothetical protein [Methylobacterium sp. E-045]|uniref:hypothetical protein n=1 Tax=Methylobacterium sp. E-045 TaxID=2836575 RepID=UPI001FBB9E45|nr:hypothetical protein [Methylobacterium sp. E-045]MCJ2128314.1 hypothetical protein [Methylobacterium sp. E-045]